MSVPFVTEREWSPLPPLFSTLHHRTVQITLSLAAKMFASNLFLCRESFFSAAMPDAEVKR